MATDHIVSDKTRCVTALRPAAHQSTAQQDRGGGGYSGLRWFFSFTALVGTQPPLRGPTLLVSINREQYLHNITQYDIHSWSVKRGTGGGGVSIFCIYTQIHNDGVYIDG